MRSFPTGCETLRTDHNLDESMRLSSVFGETIQIHIHTDFSYRASTWPAQTRPVLVFVDSASFNEHEKDINLRS